MIALEGHRFTPQEALNLGLVDHIVKGDTTAVLAKATDVAESVSSNAQMGVWGLIKVIEMVSYVHNLDLSDFSLTSIVIH